MNVHCQKNVTKSELLLQRRAKINTDDLNPGKILINRSVQNVKKHSRAIAKMVTSPEHITKNKCRVPMLLRRRRIEMREKRRQKK